MITLRDGSRVMDRRLDRLKQFDEKSRKFALRAIMPGGLKPRSYSWRNSVVLDQGREGACVGFALAHELASRPAEVPGVTAEQALNIYRAAKLIDPWPGEDYEGTSTLAGIKVLHKAGWFDSYRWAFGIEDVVMGIGYNGPAIIGINWYEGMYYPDANGFIYPTGDLVGGHCLIGGAVNIVNDFVSLRQSWGEDHGIKGTVRMRISDLGRLLKEDGEAAFLIGRRTML